MQFYHQYFLKNFTFIVLLKRNTVLTVAWNIVLCLNSKAAVNLLIKCKLQKLEQVPKFCYFWHYYGAMYIRKQCKSCKLSTFTVIEEYKLFPSGYPANGTGITSLCSSIILGCSIFLWCLQLQIVKGWKF